MAPTSTTSFASGRKSESTYASLDAHETSSDQDPSSHDEYNPFLDNTTSSPGTPPLVSGGASSALASEVHTTLSHRSIKDISDKAKIALAKLYGPPVPLCLVTQMDTPVVGHIVPNAAKPQQVW